MRMVVLAILVEVLKEFAEGFEACCEWFSGPGEPRESVVKDGKGRQSLTLATRQTTFLSSAFGT